MGYTREEIENQCSKAMNDVPSFYKQNFVNYRGKTSDTNELFSEVIAEFVCNNLDKFKSIPCITRESSYKAACHDGQHNDGSNRLEEILAMRMFNQCNNGFKYDFIGKIIDYQVPLKNTIKDDVGKIDLISLHNDTIFILELKKEDSTETMLRCVLEGFTYLRIVDHEKLKRDFNQCDAGSLKASPLTFKGKEQWKEMQEDRPQLKRLMNLLDIVPYFISENKGRYVITEG